MARLFRLTLTEREIEALWSAITNYADEGSDLDAMRPGEYRTARRVERKVALVLRSARG